MKRSLLQILTALILVLALGVAHAMSLNEAVAKVKRDTGGKVLSARTVVQGDRQMHLIKVLTQDGRVRTVRVPGDRVRKKPNANSAH